MGKIIRKIKGLLHRQPKLSREFLTEFDKLSQMEKVSGKRFTLSRDDFFPIINEKTAYTGFDRHYVYHPAWAARIVANNRPEKHVDISSTLHFCSILSAFIPVDFYDYRPAKLVLTALNSLSADLLDLPFADNSIPSLSCMHTVEHVGLGRYGDPLDYDGDLKAIKELKRVLAVGGHLLFVVPLGRENRIFFNAHRVYTKQHVLDLFADLQLVDFSLIPEDENDGGLVSDPSNQLLAEQVYGCGCFHFTK
jgi:SAM-dependent methyltransferase